jgi:hypothetical protein
LSQFEYVSVAVALVFAMAVARLLAGVPASLKKGPRYSLHVAWVFLLTFVCTLQWWIFWGAKDVAWTPARFLWAIAYPGLLYVRAGILLGEAPGATESFRAHFFDCRVPFFSVGLATAVQGALGPWVYGTLPWFAVGPLHVATAGLATLSLAGLVFTTARAHAAIVLLTSLLATAGFFFIALGPAPAA